MNSNERRPVRRPAWPTTDQKPVVEDTLKVQEIQIERKRFILTLKENPRGRFLRITEDVNGRRDNVIIPSTGLAEFAKTLAEMTKASSEIPEQTSRDIG